MQKIFSLFSHCGTWPRAAQSLVLAGVLLAGTPVFAAGADNDGDLSNGGQGNTSWIIKSPNTIVAGSGTSQTGGSLTNPLKLDSTGAGREVTASITSYGTNSTFTTSGGLTVTGSAGGTATLAIGGDKVITLTPGGTITLSGNSGTNLGALILSGSLAHATLVGDTTVGAYGRLELGSVDGTGVATHRGNVTLSGTGASLLLTGQGSKITGDLTIGSTATAVELNSANTLNVSGTSTVQGTGLLRSDSIGVGTVATGYFKTKTLVIDGSAANASVTNNGGTLTTTVRAGGTLQLQSATAAYKATHTGNVVLTAAEATLNVLGGGTGNANTIDGNVTVTNGAVQLTAAGSNYLQVTRAVQLDAGSITVGDGVNASTFTASTTTAVNGGTLKVNTGSNYISTGATTMNGGTLVVNGGARFTSNGNDVTLNAATLTLAAGGTLDLGGSATYLSMDNAAAVFNVLGGTTGTANAIDGSLEVNQGTVNIGSATRAGYLSVSGAADFKSGTTLNTYAANSALAVTGNLDVNSASILNITGGKAGVYDLVTSTGGTHTGWVGTNLTTSAEFMTVTGGWATNNYKLALSYDTVQPFFPLMQGSMVGLTDAMLHQQGLNVDSPNAGMRFMSRALSRQYVGSPNHSKATATIEGATQIAAIGAAQGVTLSAQGMGAGALAARSGFASPASSRGVAVALNDGQASLTGLSAGSGMKNGLGVWAMPLWQNDYVHGMKAGAFTTGYSSNLGGGIIGADYTFMESLRLGMALNVGGGSSTSNGDFNKTTNDFSFWGVAAYGGWNKGNFGLAADLGYSATNSEMDQKTPASMLYGNLKADVDAYAITAGLRADYVFATPALDITPHAGLRYTSLTTRGHSVKAHDGTVFDVAKNDQGIWTFPIGVAFGKTYSMQNDWTFKPVLDLGLIAASGDLKAKSRVRVPGVDYTAGLSTQVVDALTFDGLTGFEFRKNDLALGLNYNLQTSEHRTGHGLTAILRYEF